jgi:hypothetical protein
MLLFGVTIPATLPLRSEILERLTNYPVFVKSTRFCLGIINTDGVIRKFLVPTNSKFSPNECHEHSNCFLLFSAKVTHRSYYIGTYYCIQHRREGKLNSNPKHRSNRWKRYHCLLTCIRELPSSEHGRVTYTDWWFLWLSSAPLAKCHVITFS